MYRYELEEVPSPLELFLGLKSEEHAALLESASGSQANAKVSVVAWGAKKKVAIKEATSSSLRALRDEVLKTTQHDLPTRFKGGLIGYFSFEFVRAIERLPLKDDKEGWPDAELFEPEELVVYDHVAKQAFSTTRIAKREAPEPRPPTFKLSGETMSDEEFKSAVAEVKRLINEGYTFQTVISKGLSFSYSGDLEAFYGRLKQINPSPYMFFVRIGDRQVIGSSPELLFRSEAGVVETFPIAGTRARGDGAADAELERDLISSQKERAEHLMLVDLARNDLGKVCVPGTVMVPELAYVEKYSHVQHMVSRVVGYLRNGLTPVDVLEATFPAGTVSGAPKPMSLKIISQLEQLGRGPYAGAVGYLSPSSSELSISIRSAFASGESVRTQAGAGIVYDSTAGGELGEVRQKMKAVLAAMGDPS